MDPDSESTATSVEETTENLCDNPTRDSLAEGLLGLLKPAVDQLDERVRSARISQSELKQQIDCVLEDLKKVNVTNQNAVAVDIDTYVQKVITCKHKVTVVMNVLQTAQDRLNKVHQVIDRETARRKAELGEGAAAPEEAPSEEEVTGAGVAQPGPSSGMIEPKGGPSAA